MREREDDEIVEALNQYTLKLQSSLKIVNSTDGQLQNNIIELR